MRSNEPKRWLARLALISLCVLVASATAPAQQFEDLVKSLGAGEDYERAERARKLAELGNKQAVPALIKALKDPAAQVRYAAAEALGQLGDQRAVGPLVLQLRDRSHWAQQGAAEALQKLKWSPPDEQAKAWFLAALGDLGAAAKLGKVAYEPILQVLTDDRATTRAYAAEALGLLGDTRAVKPLTAAMADRDSDVQRQAMRALLKLDKEGFAAVVAALKHTNMFVRLAAVEALAESERKESVVAPLTSALTDDYDLVRDMAVQGLESQNWKPANDTQRAQYLVAKRKWDQAAEIGAAAYDVLAKAAAGSWAYESAKDIRALGKLRDPRSIGVLLKALKTRREGPDKLAAAEELVKFGDAAVKPLVSVLGHRSVQIQDGSTARVRDYASEALAKIGKPAFVQVVAALKSEKPSVGAAAALTLGRMGDSRAVKPLLAALGDKGDLRRVAAATALGKLADPVAVKPLMAAMAKADLNLRYAALHAIVKLGPAAVEPCLAMLSDTDGPGRGAAIDVLGELGDKRAVKPLMALLKDKDANVRSLAAAALIKLGSGAVEPLLAAAKSDDVKVRRLAISALAESRDMRAIDAQVAALDDADAIVRQAAMRGLDRRGWEPKTPSQKALWYAARGHWDDVSERGDERFNVLVAALKVADRRGLEEVAWMLARLGDPRAVRPMLEAAANGDREVRRSLAGGIAKIGAGAIPVLKAALSDKSRRVQVAAAVALRWLKWRPTTDAEHVQLAMASGRWGEAAFGPGALEPLLAATKDPFYLTRSGALRALGDLGDKRGLSALTAALADKSDVVRTSAARALGEFGDGRATLPLIAALKDPLENVRWSAAEGLGKLGDVRASSPLAEAAADTDPRVQTAAKAALEKLRKKE